MKDKRLIGGLIVVAILALVGAVVLLSQKRDTLGTQSASGTILHNAVHSATTTPSTGVTKYPVMVISSSTSYGYAMLQNDSTSVAYFCMGEFDNIAEAATFVTPERCSILNADGASYEWTEANLIVGTSVWVTSTAPGSRFKTVTST